MSDKTIQNTTVGTVQPGALTAIARKEDFLQHLQDFLDTHKTEKWCVAAIDVEHFRLYNELYGTEQGNTLLNTLASHLLDYQKTSGCPVGYWGNDDFFLCLPDDRVQQQDIVITLQTCVSPNHQDVTFFLALGLCPVREHPEADAATLCNYAQIAVMNPDHSGSGIHRFAPAMLDSLKAQQQLLSELEHALDNHEFTFFLQPKCNSMTRAIVGMEALVRWNHPTRGCVQPSEFMPLLESTGLISRLDQYIWEAVCQTLQKWQASGSNLVPVSVNVSVVDIVNLDVPQIFSDLVEKYQLEPKLLLAEITETMLAENSSVVENAIQGLHRKGFSVMMDDFGSGYSSLNMLKDTNVDAIKLDMKLIDMNQQNRSKGVQIVESVVDMAHRLNLPIIAEGVETPEQVSMLQAADCLYTQGYYFYKPMPVENAEALLAQPNSEDYWDMRRDLLRRDRRVPVSDSEQTALALQAYQIFADNVLELSLLNLSTGEYRVIKRDPRLPGAGSDSEEDFAAWSGYLHCSFNSAAEAGKDTPYYSRYQKAVFAVMQGWAWVYSILLTVGVVCALFFHLTELLPWIRKKCTAQTVVPWLLLFGIFGMALLRCAMIAFVEVSSFGIGTSTMYLATVHPLLALYAFVGLFLYGRPLKRKETA